MKEYSKAIFEEILVTTFWEKIEKSLIADVEKAKEEVASSNKSENKEELEIELKKMDLEVLL